MKLIVDQNDNCINLMFPLQVFPLLLHYNYLTFSVTVTVKEFDLFPLMIISVTITINLNHTAHTDLFYNNFNSLIELPLLP